MHLVHNKSAGANDCNVGIGIYHESNIRGYGGFVNGPAAALEEGYQIPGNP